VRTILNNLFNHQTLSRQQAREVLVNIATAKYYPAQVASFMSVYLMRPITVEELSGFRDAMLELCTKVEFEQEHRADIVGTGGDGKDTFNISTLACFVAAGAGIKVSKHGNYGVSSVTGSSNVLEAIGYKFANDISILKTQLDKAGLCFLHAPLFHPAMKNVAPVRKELGVRTFFNLLGPVVNPSFPDCQVLGVYDLGIARLYNYLLQETKTKYVVLHSFDGYDEISLTGTYKVISRQGEQLVEPIERIAPGALEGGRTVEDSAKLFMNILRGGGTPEQNRVVAVNASMAIACVTGKPSAECQALAEESLAGGKAYDVFKKLVK
jgi:anthranilate phosphoribosyltransferase